jgi:hypothetical protein
MINKRHTVSGLKSAHGVQAKMACLCVTAACCALAKPTQPGRADGTRRGGASTGGSPVDGARQGARLQHHC